VDFEPDCDCDLGKPVAAAVFGHRLGQRVCGKRESARRTVNGKVALNSVLRPLCRDLKGPRLEIIDHESAWDQRRRKRCSYPLRLAGPSLSPGCFLLLLAIYKSFDISFVIHFGPKACQPTFDNSFVIFVIDDLAL
jgi:hypothetical protein